MSILSSRSEFTIQLFQRVQLRFRIFRGTLRTSLVTYPVRALIIPPYLVSRGGTMSSVEWMSLATGTLAIVVALASFLIVICTAATMFQEGKTTIMVGSILSAAFCALVGAVGVTLQWLYRWSPSQSVPCDIVAGRIVSFFYCCTIGSVLQFLHCRALLVDDKARSTLLMRMIQVGIISVVPFGAFSAAVSTGQVDNTFCVSNFPLYLAAMFVMAAFAFSALLIYKFTSSLREHQARIASSTSGKSSAGHQARSDSLEQIARRNLFYSVIALGATTSTMIYLLLNDIMFAAFDPFHQAIENFLGLIDVAINITVVCTCSNVWIPRALKASSTAKATTAGDTKKSKQHPSTVL